MTATCRSAPDRSVRARRSSAQRAQWRERSVAAFAPYAEYQTKTDRQLPVFVLEPADAPHDA